MGSRKAPLPGPEARLSQTHKHRPTRLHSSEMSNSLERSEQEAGGVRWHDMAVWGKCRLLGPPRLGTLARVLR